MASMPMVEEDHRLSVGGGAQGYLPPQHRLLFDPKVTFDEYHFYAQACRREEAANAGSAANKGRGIINTLIPGRRTKEEKASEAELQTTNENINSHETRMHITDEEWTNASRALRLATWPAMFYLITTDILGPYTLPFAIATTGWGPGITLYTIFGALAGYSGYLLWKMWLGLDSYQYPLRSYADLGYRIYGPWARHGINFLQSLQLLCNVGVIVIQNGQSLSQVAKFRLCYAICCLIFTLLGFALGQIRTLKNFGWIANFAVWINLLVIFITMGVAANSPPNYAASGSSAGFVIGGGADPNPLIDQLPDGSYPPVQTSGGQPSKQFSAAVNGLMQAVYSYGGAMLFVEFMSEMKRPYDFIKSMWGAQAFIYFFYMFYGSFMYGYQGQYAVNPSYQGLSPYAWQVVANVIAMISALIAAALYGNIGIKVLYNNILAEFLSAPPLTSKKGRIVWAVVVPIYWSVAFIIAAAIPNFSGLTALVAALCILQFTYTFPPILYFGYIIQRNTLRILGLAPKENHSAPGRPNEPVTGSSSPPYLKSNGDEKSSTNDATTTPPEGPSSDLTRNETSHSAHLQRYGPRNQDRAARRTAMKQAIIKQLPHLTWLMIYFLGALVTAGLGSYSAIESLIVAFENPAVTAFTCHSPLDNTG